MESDERFAQVPLDSRALSMVTARYDILAAAAERWSVPETAPAPVLGLLAVSRRLFAHGVFVWEFFAVGCAWSLIAVERALRDALLTGDKIPPAKLIDRAETDGTLPPREADLLRTAGVRLRNEWVHGTGTPAVTPGIAEGIIASSHLLVTRLYEGWESQENAHDPSTA